MSLYLGLQGAAHVLLLVLSRDNDTSRLVRSFLLFWADHGSRCRSALSWGRGTPFACVRSSRLGFCVFLQSAGIIRNVGGIEYLGVSETGEDLSPSHHHRERVVLAVLCHLAFRLFVGFSLFRL